MSRGHRPQKTLKFVPQIDVPLLDPVVTSAYISRNHGFVVFDTLFGQDSAFKAQPQMVDGFTTEPDGKTWRLTLRDGLKFHDGTPVLARDCVASINRWGKRDAFGQALMAATDELSAPDDKTIVFRLKRPFPLLPDALGKVAGIMCAIMPERLAQHRTPSSRSTRWSAVARSATSPPSGCPGHSASTLASRVTSHGRRARRAAPPGPRSRTSIASSGVPSRMRRRPWPRSRRARSIGGRSRRSICCQPARRNASLTLDTLDPSGLPGMLRFNHLQPPFNNPAIRRALLGAVDQADFMQAVAGTDHSLWKDDVGFFAATSPLANNAGVSVFEGQAGHDEGQGRPRCSRL